MHVHMWFDCLYGAFPAADEIILKLFWKLDLFYVSIWQIKKQNKPLVKLRSIFKNNETKTLMVIGWTLKGDQFVTLSFTR